MSEQPLPTKERIRAALDVLENYVGTDGKIDATKMTQEITRLRQQAAEDNELIEAQKAEILELQEMRDACDEYLKDGETPAECIERWRNDAQRMMKMLADVTDDAERYRWLRDKCGDWSMLQDWFWHESNLDNAINAARASDAGES